MKQSFVIFVCTFDPFHIGRHVYTFENRCVEDPNLPLNDGTQKIILNTKGIFDDVRPELKRLLNFIDGRQPEDSFTQALNKALQHLPVVCFPPVNIRILKFLKLPDFPWNKFRL